MRSTSIEAGAATSGPWLMVFAAWLLATAATLAALFLGEVMGLPVCVLCWYQRIAMFPLALVLPFALFPLSRAVMRAGLVLALAGLALAVFHQLLVAGIIPEAIKPCTQGVPCGKTVAVWFGFVTIPLMAIATFSLIVALLAAALSRTQK
jgi:disulfide bond formation protein DsbB